MKKAILLFTVILAAGKLFAQTTPQPDKKSPVSVTLKTDTIVYRIDHSMVEHEKVDQLLRMMPALTTGADGSFVYQGQIIKKFRMNGRDYNSLSMQKAIQRLPVSLVDNIEIIDDYSNLPSPHTSKGPDEVININIKQSVMADLDYYLANRPSRPLYPRGRYDNPDLYGDIYVDEHNPLDRRVNRAISNMLALSDQMHEVDQYGDQIPHFLIPTPYPVKDVFLKRDTKADKDRVPKALRLNP